MVLRRPEVSASPQLTSETPARRGLGALIWPWLVALGILGFLFSRISGEALVEAFQAGPWVALGVYTFIQWLLILVADSFATKVSLDITGFKQRYSQIVLARGATYIMGIFNYALGQGALGVYLQRSGVTALRATGNMVFLMIVNLGVLLLIASFGFLSGGSPQTASLNLWPLFLGLYIGMILYLTAVGRRPPRVFQKNQVLSPLWQAGLRGHLRGAAARLPHMLLLVLAYWGALRLWGIPVPVVQGLAMIPVVLFINAVPVTPLGLGTTQAALVLLFSPYVPLAHPEIQAAVVLAFSLIYYVFGLMAQAAIGMWCFQKIRTLRQLQPAAAVDDRSR